MFSSGEDHHKQWTPRGRRSIDRIFVLYTGKVRAKRDAMLNERSYRTITKALAIIVLLIAAAWDSTALAQAYPSKPIRLIVPYAPGGPTDIIGRVIAKKLSDGLGQQIVVENRLGAGGTIGTETAAKSPADGYTILLGVAATLAISPSLYPKLGYDPVESFAPISLLTIAPHLIIISSSVPASSVTELIEAAKAKPGQLSYGSAGTGTILHIAGEMFKTLAGVDLVHVPYKGGAPAMTDLLAGRIQIMFEQLATVQPYLPGGKVRILAVAASKRHAQLPDIPTAAEAGLPGFEAVAWFGLLSPQGTPSHAIMRLNAEVQKALATKEIRDTLANHGMEPSGSSPERFSTLIKTENAKWSQVIKTAGIKID